MGNHAICHEVDRAYAQLVEVLESSDIRFYEAGSAAILGRQGPLEQW